jgi:hypothetical protein
MIMASRLSRGGYDIECIDLEKRHRFDFLATRHNVAFEIECKTTSPDKGRKIHRRNLHLLSYELVPITKQLVNAGGGHVIRLIIPDRLEKNKPQLENLEKIVTSAVRDGTALSNVGQAEYEAVKIDYWPRPDELEITARELLEKSFGRARSRHVIARMSPRHGLVAIGVESKKPDTVVQTLADDAKAAADQCTGDRPALITIQLVEITPDELTTLGQTMSGIQHIVHEIFKDDNRAHVDSITFTLPPIVSPHQLLGGKVLSGNERIFYNPSPKMPSDAVRGFFKLPIS